jgi:hypothetical protein
MKKMEDENRNFNADWVPSGIEHSESKIGFYEQSDSVTELLFTRPSNKAFTPALSHCPLNTVT